MFWQLPQYLVDHEDLFAEYTGWERKHQSEQEALAAEQSREAELKRKSAKLKRNSVKLKRRIVELNPELKRVELKRKRVEPKRERTGYKRKSAEAGRQKEDRPEAAKKRRRSLELPDEKDVWEFLEGEKGWDYARKGYSVSGPDEGSKPMEACEVS